MAEQAQQEPTMEEILSSIRKIIADDEQPGAEVPTAAVSPDVVEIGEADEAAFDDLDLSVEEASESPPPETEEEVLEALGHVDEDDDDVFEAVSSYTDLAVPSDNKDSEDDFTVAAEPSVIEEYKDEASTYDELDTVVDGVEEAVPQDLPAMTEEPEMTNAAITDDRTADAAAGSLGKLFSKVEFGEEAGGGNTIEGVVREMLRPMLKEWLDDNLPAIVEKSVEAEVQRIARMAR